MAQMSPCRLWQLSPLVSNLSLKNLLLRFCQLTILVNENPAVQKSISWMFLALEGKLQKGQVGISAT
jgi:hypothetical protein